MLSHHLVGPNILLEQGVAVAVIVIMRIFPGIFKISLISICRNIDKFPMLPAETVGYFILDYLVL